MYRIYKWCSRYARFAAVHGSSGLMIALQSLAVRAFALRDAEQAYRACTNCCCGCWLLPALCCVAPPRRCRFVNTFQCHPGLPVPCIWKGWSNSRVSKGQPKVTWLETNDSAGRWAWWALACSFCRSSARIAQIALHSMSTIPTRGRRGHGIGPCNRALCCAVNACNECGIVTRLLGSGV